MSNSKYEHDQISDFFRTTLNKKYKLNLNSEKTTIFIRSYFSLLDSYISYNERQLNKEYILSNPFEYNYKKDSKTPHFPHFEEIIEKSERNIDQKIRRIRNALTHDFWMFLSSKDIEKISSENPEGNIKEYINDIIEDTMPENIILIFKKMNFYDERTKTQWQKFKEEIINKMIPSLEKNDISLSFLNLKFEKVNPNVVFESYEF